MPHSKDLKQYPEEFFSLFDLLKSNRSVEIPLRSQSELISFRARWNMFIRLIKDDPKHPDNAHAWRMSSKIRQGQEQGRITLALEYGSGVGSNYTPEGLRAVLASQKKEPEIAQQNPGLEHREELTDVLSHLGYGKKEGT